MGIAAQGKMQTGHQPSARADADCRLQIADGRKTVEQIRADTAKRVMKHSESSPLADGENSKATTMVAVVPNDDDDSEPDYGPQTIGINPPEARRRGLIARAEEALRLANFDDLDGLERWSWFPGQNGGLAKVDSGFDYAAKFSCRISIA
jgi:hypothetical protein